MISAMSNQVSKQFGDCITGDGFYLIKDQELLFVRTITEESDRLYENYDLHSNYEKYNIKLLDASQDAHNVSAISVPETDIPAEDNLEAYFIHHSPDQQEAIVTKGLISDVKSTEEEVSFLFKPTPAEIDTPYPLFVRVNEAVQLIGIFSPLKNRFIHIHEFSNETRTPPVIVVNGQFKGTEVGRRGSGPRAIQITGPGFKCGYDLKFQRDGKYWNPHYDGEYNKKGNQPLLYQAALDSFVQNQPEGDFTFNCYDKLYKASK